MPFIPDSQNNQGGFKPEQKSVFTPDPITTAIQDPEKGVAASRSFTDSVGSFLEKVDGVISRVSELGFGTFGKVGGGILGMGAENLNKLFPQKESIQKLDPALEQQLKQKGKSPEEIKKEYNVETEKSFTKSLEEMTKSKGETAKTSAMLALELYPGGKVISETLSKLPGGSKIIEHIAELPEGLKNSAIKQYSKIFNATSKESKALAKEVTPGLLERGQIITSTGKLAEKAEVKASEYGSKIDEYFNNLPDSVKEKTKPILDKLGELKQKYIVDGKVIRTAVS